MTRHHSISSVLDTLCVDDLTGFEVCMASTLQAYDLVHLIGLLCEFHKLLHVRLSRADCTDVVQYSVEQQVIKFLARPLLLMM